MLTGETITDEQIRGLADVLRDTRANNRLIAIALHGPTQREVNAGYTRKKARARCADILNARKGT
jgi:hypothetical protein